MALFLPQERRAANDIADIAFGNPFDERRIERERKLLGPDFVEAGTGNRFWPGATYREMFPNVGELHGRAEDLAKLARRRLGSGREADDADLRLYQDLVCYVLYNRHASLVHDSIREALGSPDWGGPAGLWTAFLADYRAFLEIPVRDLSWRHRPEHMFAIAFQVERAFHWIFEYVVGGSEPAARLRAAVWQSIFTKDMRRYMRTLYRHMADFPTLITGPSGSGKELVARAVGQSLYAEFDPARRRFAERRYVALNLSALAPTLIESELFGHVMGAFNDAKDRAGWLEECGGPDTANAIFLDEIGELDASIQVKLLRVLQERRFARVGESRRTLREFRGKVIAATNRDLAAEMRAGRFRRDFYYRLCADVIATPALKDQLADRPEDLPDVVRYVVSRRVLRLEGPGAAPAPDEEVDALVVELVEWIDRNLGVGYRWPGNFRELEQCVRNWMIRGHYQPPGDGPPEGEGGPIEAYLSDVREGQLTHAALVGGYYTLVLLREGGCWAAASRRLRVNYRTLQRWIDQEFYNCMIGIAQDDAGSTPATDGHPSGTGPGQR
jgi:DNA-binding NtrC family response regulator